MSTKFFLLKNLKLVRQNKKGIYNHQTIVYGLGSLSPWNLNILLFISEICLYVVPTQFKKHVTFFLSFCNLNLELIYNYIKRLTAKSMQYFKVNILYGKL